MQKVRNVAFATKRCDGMVLCEVDNTRLSLSIVSLIKIMH